MVAFLVWGQMTSVRFRVVPCFSLIKMATKSKKSKSSGRFGARYGRSIRAKLVNVESKQRVKQKCPFCQKLGVKRVSKGIWKCSKCDKKFASDIYHLQ